MFYFLERNFCGILIKSLRKQTYVYEKQLYCIQPIRCTAKLGTFYAIDGNGSKMTLVAGATKLNLKNLKT